VEKVRIMSEKSIVVIGAGIAGLAAGCYARMNGYGVRICEAHDKPGGLCTAWKRGEYIFDGCLHWLTGSSPANGFHRIWRELGAVQGRTFIDRDIHSTYFDENGRPFHFYTDADRLREHIRELSPPDADLADALADAIKRLSEVSFDFGDPGFFKSLFFGVRMLALAPLFQKYGELTVDELGKKFTDPLVREAIRGIFGYPDTPALGLVMMLGSMHKRSAGFPVGGSLPLARAVEKRCLDLGARIDYRARVKRIIVENDRARGVELEDGTTVRADAVISAADGHATVFDLLGGRYVSGEVASYYRKLPIFRPLVQVSLGVNRDMRGELAAVRRRLREPIEIAGETRDTLGYRQFAEDGSFAPPGKTVVECLFASDYEYWKRLRDQGDEAYRAEKEKILKTVLAELEKFLPGVGVQVEASDVATPLTFERCTGNWQGSMEGWRLTKETMRFMINGMKKTLPGLANFHMAGQWVKPGGGLPPSAQAGREVIAEICRKDRRQFRAMTD
jgi:phytoene dehydrogenase-like protein